MLVELNFKIHVAVNRSSRLDEPFQLNDSVLKIEVVSENRNILRWVGCSMGSMSRQTNALNFIRVIKIFKTHSSY